MEPSKPIVPFDWQRLFFSDHLPTVYLWEIAFRSLIMYLLILAALRLSGKRRVKQLSLFELTIILGLGSAAGDPMFYHDVPLGHALVVFSVVVSLYLLFNYLTEKSRTIEKWLEGKSICVIDEGVIRLPTFTKENVTYEELFAEMRMQHIEHLGQVRRVYLEATGELSIFFYEPEAVRPGLPILPEIFKQPFVKITRPGRYACVACGTTLSLTASEQTACSTCQATHWVEASASQRVT